MHWRAAREFRNTLESRGLLQDRHLDGHEGVLAHGQRLRFA